MILSGQFVLEQEVHEWNKDEALFWLSYLVYDFK